MAGPPRQRRDAGRGAAPCSCSLAITRCPSRCPAGRRLVHRRREPAHEVLEVPGELGTGAGKGHDLSPHVVGRTDEASRVSDHLKAPPPEVEVQRDSTAGVMAGPRRERAVRAGEVPAAEPHGDQHLCQLERHPGDVDRGQVEKMLACSGDPHGFCLGSIGFATSNLEVRVRVTLELARPPPGTPSVPPEKWHASPLCSSRRSALSDKQEPLLRSLCVPTSMPEDPHFRASDSDGGRISSRSPGQCHPGRGNGPLFGAAPAPLPDGRSALGRASS